MSGGGGGGGGGESRWAKDTFFFSRLILQSIKRCFPPYSKTFVIGSGV